MVSNQSVAITMQGLTRIGAMRTAAALSLLMLLSGCELLGFGTKEKVEEPEPVVAAPVEAPTEPENAIDAALARAGNPAPDQAQQETADLAGARVNASAPLSYTVKRGDTLWGISAMYLRDPWLWPEIWHVNPGVRNPHLIYPGDQLALAYGSDGQPQLRLTRGDALRVSPLVRSNPIDGPIATIPFEAIQAFLGRPGILSKEDLHEAPYVVGMRDRHIVAGADMQAYVKGLKGASGRHTIVHPGEEIRDPETGDVLGYMGIYTGTARIEPTESKLSRAVLLESARETLKGDLVFADDTQVTSADIVPHAPPAGLKGQIMAVYDGVQLIGQYHVVAVNRGTKHGLETGHVLAVDLRGEVVQDPGCRRSMWAWCYGENVRLPDERAGTLLVFKTYDRMSFGLIVNATAPLSVADVVRTP